MRIRPVVWTLLVTCVAAMPLAAQKRKRKKAIDVFLDCETMSGCTDFDFFRRQVPYVNWVRDRQDADVHVLITSQTTGGGGQHFTISFLGLRSFNGHDEDLTASTAGDATPDEVRRAVADKLKIGLVAYLVNTPVVDRLRVSLAGQKHGGPGGAVAGAAPARGVATATADPWNFWVFSVSGSGYVNGEASTHYSNYSGSISANRTTKAWRIGLGADYYRNEERYDLSTGTVTSIRKDWGMNGLLVRSLGAQWALGVKASAGSSTYNNEHLNLSLQPGIEYDFFPYGESSRRMLTLQYLAGPQYYRYDYRTIYGHTSETRAQQSLTARLSLVQPWGSWSTSVTTADYLGETSKYHTSINGYVNVRLFKGFSVRVSAYYTWLHDQIYISSAGLTDQEILLRQQQLATQFQYFTSVSISYRFGSIFNNIVNPRFGGSNSGMMIIMG